MRYFIIYLYVLLTPFMISSQGELSFKQEFDDGDAITGGTVTELNTAFSVAVSPDGKNIYVVSLVDGGVMIFDRAADGSLSFKDEFDDGDAITGGTVTELAGASSVTVSPDGKNVYVVSFVDDGVVIFDRAADGSLSFKDEFDDGDIITGGTVTELDGAYSVTVSPDGKNVYVVSRDDAGVVIFDRAADGSLSFKQEFDDGDTITGGTVTKLDNAASVTVSPDGKNVYVVSLLDAGVMIFDRAADGSLSFKDEFSDGDAITGGTVTELAGVASVTVSPDGKNVYVVSGGDHGVVVFDRAADGSLSFKQEFDDDDTITGGTVTKLNGAISVTVSPDGKNVYVVSLFDNGVVIFDRATDGSLSFKQEFDDGDTITGGTVTELNGAISVTVSPDGKNVYVVSSRDDGVVVFDRAVPLPVPIPTLSQWGLIILGLCLITFGMVTLRQRKTALS